MANTKLRTGDNEYDSYHDPSLRRLANEVRRRERDEARREAQALDVTGYPPTPAHGVVTYPELRNLPGEENGSEIGQQPAPHLVNDLVGPRTPHIIGDLPPTPPDTIPTTPPPVTDLGQNRLPVRRPNAPQRGTAPIPTPQLLQRNVQEPQQHIPGGSQDGVFEEPHIGRQGGARRHPPGGPHDNPPRGENVGAAGISNINRWNLGYWLTPYTKFVVFIWALIIHIGSIGLECLRLLERAIKRAIRWTIIIVYTIASHLTTLPFLLILLSVFCTHQYLILTYLCPPINTFCAYHYNPLRPMVCPVDFCSSIESTSSSQPPVYEPPNTISGSNTATTHLRTLFRIPHDMAWSAASLQELQFFIGKSDIVNRTELTTLLASIISDIDTATPEFTDFTNDYIYHVNTIHAHTKLFEDVFTRIVAQASTSPCPDWDWLVYHDISDTASQTSWTYHFSSRWISCKLGLLGGGPFLSANATTTLQTHFEDYISATSPHLTLLHTDATRLTNSIASINTSLSTFLTLAAKSTHHLQHHQRAQVEEVRTFFARLWVSLGNAPNDMAGINANAAVLKRCETDLMDAALVVRGIVFRTHQAGAALMALGLRLRNVKGRDVRVGWEGASVLVFAKELRGFLGGMSAGFEYSEEVRMEVEEMDWRRWNEPKFRL